MTAQVNTEPIIAGFAPDPTICRVGEDYYVANSSFEYFPAAPIFHSTDLVNWEQIGNIIDRPEQFEIGAGEDSGGIYGSTLRHYGGRFWLITTNMNSFMSGQVIYHAEDAAGPWSDPVHVSAAIGIDPDLAWDADGACYLTYKVPSLDPSGATAPFIGQAVINPLTGELLSEVRPLTHGTGLADTEAPHLYQIDDWWYLVTAEGGTQRGHLATVARATAPNGPFEPSPYGPLLTHRSTDHPVQCTGHADLVQAADGSWAAVFLGARPWGLGPGFHTVGRETFLTGITWTEDGWPIADETTYVVPVRDHSFHEDFDPDFHLDPRWISVARPLDFIEWRGDGLTLSAKGKPATLVTRVRDHHWSAEIALARVYGVGGLILRLDSDHWCEIVVVKNVATAVAHLSGASIELGSAEIAEGALTLRVESVPAPWTGLFPSASPDRLEFSLESDTGRADLGGIDGRYFSTEVAGGFTGRTVGVFIRSGNLTVSSFDYRAKR